MWILYVVIGVVVIVVPVVIFLTTTTVRKKKANPNQKTLTELDNLKAKNLITEQEYNEKRAEILHREGGKK